ncbi:hypothetical protein H5995_00595 [Megamonas rupellensis]|uniref:hypothetical protein n=1 Tax=Megamonas rupellensis TaxID=491921 RepID=UPI00195CE89D|nr:hypothetical protein [Megamonas rupellensis]MBM6747784.1 hypothetical protein [Megamonas rupellensis]
MFYVQDDIVIDMADFFPLNKHSIDDKFQRLQQRIESVKNFKAKYNEMKQYNRQKYSD